jgi:hypothetical protein
MRADRTRNTGRDRVIGLLGTTKATAGVRMVVEAQRSAGSG